MLFFVKISNFLNIRPSNKIIYIYLIAIKKNFKAIDCKTIIFLEKIQMF